MLNSGAHCHWPPTIAYYEPPTAMHASSNRRFLLLVVPLLAFAFGCTRSSAPSGGPSVDEIKKLRANQSQDTTPTPAMRAIAALPIREWGVKETAVDAIARIGEPAVPVLIQSLSDPDPGVRAQAARALARMGVAAKPAVPDLVKALHDPDESVQIAAARALGQMGPAAAEALPALVELIKAPDKKPNP